MSDTQSSDNTTIMQEAESDDDRRNLTCIELMINNKLYPLTPAHLPFKMGRGKDDVNLVITGDVVSRHHCTIEYREDRLGVTDSSTNGTHIQVGPTTPIAIKNEFYPLHGRGMIKLGDSFSKDKGEIIYYKVR